MSESEMKTSKDKSLVMLSVPQSGHFPARCKASGELRSGGRGRSRFPGDQDVETHILPPLPPLPPLLVGSRSLGLLVLGLSASRSLTLPPSLA